MKDLLLCVQVAVNTSYLDISRCHLADYVKQLQQKRAARAARLFFLIQPIRLFSRALIAVAIVIAWTPHNSKENERSASEIFPNIPALLHVFIEAPQKSNNMESYSQRFWLPPSSLVSLTATHIFFGGFAPTLIWHNLFFYDCIYNSKVTVFFFCVGVITKATCM